MDVRLDGKRVVVTAGAAGIGLATAEAMMASGARVHICDVDEAALATVHATMPGIGTTHADVSDPRAVDQLFDEAEAELRGLDILVNNAGIAGPTKPVEEVEPVELQRTMEVNVYGQFYCARRAVSLLRAAGGGSIVNLSSVAGRLGFALRSPYSASKWAVIGFTKSLAIELGPDQIRVNAICPGAVEGPAIDRAITAKAKARGLSFEAVRAEYLDQASMRTIVTVQDVARLIVFLCSDLGRTISGQAIGIDGNTVALVRR